MTDTTALLRLLSWLSPVFPTGGFAYSGALEQAVHDGVFCDSNELRDRLKTLLQHGPPWNDAVLFTAAWRAAEDAAAVAELSALARALNGSLVRCRESADQGTAFLDAAIHWFEPDRLPPPGTPLCIAVGAACGLRSIALEDGLAAFLHAFLTNQLQAAIRLSVIGQSGAANLLAELEPVISRIAQRASATTLDDLGSCTILTDIASMKHETLEPRLFLS